MSTPEPSWEVRVGDALERLREMPDESVQCVVTSPPYWGLRDYGTAEWEGGDPECDHEPPQEWIDHNFNAKSAFGKGAGTQSAAAKGRWYRPDGSCRCGATRVDHQIGLEETPEQYVARMVEVFGEVRRVLREDGTLWLNLGDSYAGTGDMTGGTNSKEGSAGRSARMFRRGTMDHGLKPKDLVGIPWRVAFALQADGWWLRSDVVWAKSNPMPESVRDRPTKAHEYVFLLSKAERYFYDDIAVREPHADVSLARAERNRFGGKFDGADPARHGSLKMGNNYGPNGDPDKVCHPAGRNKRTVWEITTRPFPDSHFAVFPPELPEVCIKAGASEKGCCPECGAPWERVVERERVKTSESPRYRGNGDRNDSEDGRTTTTTTTTGWQPTCSHDSEPVPCTVLDPFAGAGTTGLVALRLRRSFIGIELSEEYATMARRRIRNDAPLFHTGWEVAP